VVSVDISCRRPKSSSKISSNLMRSQSVNGRSRAFDDRCCRSRLNCSACFWRMKISQSFWFLSLMISNVLMLSFPCSNFTFDISTRVSAEKPVLIRQDHSGRTSNSHIRKNPETASRKIKLFSGRFSDIAA
jgi:hypothetical protein